MRMTAKFFSILAILMLSGCEQKFEEKFEDNLQELQSEAEKIKSQTEERLTAGREADEAAAQVDPVPK